MNILSTIRSQERPVARALAALFLMVWLNMALAPCLMAAEAMMPDWANGCDHCPQPEDPPCHGGPETDDRCAWNDGPEFSGRMAGPDTLLVAPAPVPAAFLIIERAAAPPVLSSIIDSHSPWSRQGPPLYLEKRVLLN